MGKNSDYANHVSSPNRSKLKINNLKIPGKNLKYLTEQHKCLNNQWFTEEIKVEIGKIFELSENKNLAYQN